MKSGARPTRLDHRDYDLLRTRKPVFGAVQALPNSYSVSANLRVPNQEAQDNNFTPPVPAMPYGCTSYAQCEICTNEDGVLYNPAYIESFSHANANGGSDVRKALDVVVKKGVQDQQGVIHTNHPAYFNIRPARAIDSFDSVRLAMLSTSSERRGVSIGSPYWLQWGAVGPNGILPQPGYDLQFASWHNWVVEGWELINNELYLTCQMLQGTSYGKNGIVYMPRDQFNKTMAVSGSCAFTIDKLLPNEQVQTVDMNIVQMIVSFIRQLFNIT